MQVEWDNADRSFIEQVPAFFMKGTLQAACGNLVYPVWEPMLTEKRLVEHASPLSVIDTLTLFVE